MMIDCQYYELLEEKNFKDGNFISAKQKLLYICTEENKMMFETIDKTNIKRFFWINENEVKFLEKKLENWSKEKIANRQKEIKGKWL